MYITVMHRDVPALGGGGGSGAGAGAGAGRRRSSATLATEVDGAAELALLVNPECHVRVLLEYVRATCRLDLHTEFDLCDESGHLKGLFGLPSYACALETLERRRVYYLVVLRYEGGGSRRPTALLQLNRNTKLYAELSARLKKFLQERPPLYIAPTAAGSLASQLTKT